MKDREYRKLTVAKPPITSFFHIDIPLTIIYSDERAHPWIFNNYIHLYSIKNVKVEDDQITDCFVDFYHSYLGAFCFYELSTCPWILFERISRRDIDNKWDDIIIFTKEKINEEKYIGISIQREKISNYFPMDGSHNLFIYGYDDNREVLYCADHFQNGIFDFEEVKYNEFVESLRYPYQLDMKWGALEGVCLFSRIERMHEKVYDISIPKIIYELRLYLNHETFVGKQDDYFIFGINCYDNMIYYYKLISECCEECCLKAIHTQREHKKLMLLRIKYLMKTHSKIASLYEPFENIFEQLVVVLNYLIRYNIFRKTSLLHQCIDRLEKIKQEETKSVLLLIDSLLQI